MTDKDLQIIYGNIISRCWEDPEYKANFIKNPKELMKEAGLPVDEASEYKVVEAEPTDHYILLPHDHVQETAKEISKLLLTVAENTDIIVPEGTRIIVLQNTPTLKYFVLKKAPDILSDVELDMVTGGAKAATASVTAVIGVVVTVSITAAFDTVAAANICAGATVVVAAAGVVFI